jgi:ribosomal protein S12 methylthiotransferase
LYPDEIDDELIDIIQSDARVLPYLDMPIQHINDRLLKLMFRKTSKEDILSTIQKLREKIPHIVIRTSLMVGFPSETDAEFLELIDFVEKTKLDNVGVFSYSREELSYSHQLEGHMDESIKQARWDRLMQVQQKATRKRFKSYVGKTLTVIVDGVHPEVDHLFIGRFYGQCPEIDGCVIINGGFEHVKAGTFVEVNITDSLDYDLVGQAIKNLSEQKVASDSTHISQKGGQRRSLQIL